MKHKNYYPFRNSPCISCSVGLFSSCPLPWAHPWLQAEDTGGLPWLFVLGLTRQGKPNICLSFTALLILANKNLIITEKWLQSTIWKGRALCFLEISRQLGKQTSFMTCSQIIHFEFSHFPLFAKFSCIRDFTCLKNQLDSQKIRNSNESAHGDSKGVGKKCEGCCAGRRIYQ